MRRQKSHFRNFSVKPVIDFLNMYRFKVTVLLGGLFLLFILGFISYLTTAPYNFDSHSVFTIEKGSTLNQIAANLAQKHYIRSEFLFKIIVSSIYAGGKNAVAGEYNFDQPVSAFTMAERIIAGDFELTPIKVTIPEGLNKFELADLLAKRLPDFNKKKFTDLAPEGYLFPDTYFFTPNITAEDVIAQMRENFDEKIQTLGIGIEKFGKPLDDVIKMASIVETEARLFDTRQIIADILWRRLEKSMPLQVDVTFKYVNGKTTEDLTLKDLATDSPYNSYTNTGLPPTPIANPGLDSILATISPKSTKYLYFLSDRNGNMHYAVTFDEHKKNKIIYMP